MKKKYRNYIIVFTILLALCITVCFIPIGVSRLIPVIEKQVSDDLGVIWIEAETLEAAQRIAEDEFCDCITIKEISKEQYDKEMKEFNLAKQIHDELTKEYDIDNISIRDYSQLCKTKREEILKRSNNN